MTVSEWLANREPHVIDDYRVPSGYKKCRGKLCPETPVADMNRSSGWWAYCQTHLAVYNSELRADGKVWWKGIRV